MSGKIELLHPLKVSTVHGEHPLEAVDSSIEAVERFLNQLKPYEEVIAIRALIRALEKRGGYQRAQADLSLEDAIPASHRAMLGIMSGRYADADDAADDLLGPRSQDT
jgi:hypothetical protein